MSKILIDRAVLEQALECLEGNISYDFHGNPYEESDELMQTAAANLRAVLEQPQVEQEPIAWANINKQGDITHTSNKKMPWAKAPLYLHPQHRQPLTCNSCKGLGRVYRGCNEWAACVHCNTTGIGGEK